MFPQEQRLVEDSTREVKKVRKARNRRLEWNMMAYDKEFRPDNRFSPSPYHMASSEGSLSPDNRQVLPPTPSAHGSPLLCSPSPSLRGMCCPQQGRGAQPVVASWIAGVPRVSSWPSGAALALGYKTGALSVSQLREESGSALLCPPPLRYHRSAVSYIDIFVTVSCFVVSTPKYSQTHTPRALSHEYNSGVFLCCRSYASDAADHSYPASPNHPAQLLAPASHLAPAEHKEGVLAATNPPEHVFRPAAGSRQNSLTRLQQPHAPPPPEAVLNGPRPHLVKDYG